MNYHTYINSEEWKAKSREWRTIIWWCQRCNPKKKRWLKWSEHIHHKHYRTLGHETTEDIMALCEECHVKMHYDVQGNRVTEKDRQGFLTDKVEKIIISKNTKSWRGKWG